MAFHEVSLILRDVKAWAKYLMTWARQSFASESKKDQGGSILWFKFIYRIIPSILCEQENINKMLLTVEVIYKDGYKKGNVVFVYW